MLSDIRPTTFALLPSGVRLQYDDAAIVQGHCYSAHAVRPLAWNRALLIGIDKFTLCGFIGNISSSVHNLEDIRRLAYDCAIGGLPLP